MFQKEPMSTRFNAKSLMQYKTDLDKLMKQFNPNQKLEKIVIFRQLYCSDDQNYNHTQKKQIQCILEAQAQISYSQFQISLRKLFKIDAMALNLRNLPIQDDYGSISKEFREKLNEIMKKQRHNNAQKIFNWCSQITSKEYDDFLLQIKYIYDICLKVNTIFKQICNQNYQYSILLHQNFNNLTLMHVASIVHGLLCDGCETHQLIDFPKTMYFNFTGKEQQESLDFWASFNQYYHNFIQFYTAKFDADNAEINQKKGLETAEIQQCQPIKEVGYGQFVIPIQFNNKKIVNKYQLKIVFDFLLRRRIIDFRPNLIFVDVLVDENLIELEALERLIRKFAKYSKVIIHLRFSPDEQNPKTENFLSILNAVLNGLQGFKKIHTQNYLGLVDYQERDEWLKNMYYYFDCKTDKSLARLFLSERQMQKMKYKQHLNQNKANFKRPLYILDSKQELQQINITDEFDKAVVSYEFKKIILQDFNQLTAILLEFDKWLNVINRQVIENVPKQCSVIILQDKIIFAYSFEVKGNVAYVEDQIIIYRIVEQNSLICVRDQEIMNTVFKKPKKFARKMTAQEIRDKIITKRRGQQVCYNSISPENNYTSFMLIGGEIWNSFQLMNVIECLYIDEQSQKFFSLIVDNSKISLLTSIRPFPDMLILEQSSKQRQIYLSFDGNLLLKYQYYYTMLNPNNSKRASLLLIQNKKFELLNIEVEKKEFRLEDFKSEDYNQILIEDSEYSIVWKVICTRFSHIKKAHHLPQKYRDIFPEPTKEQYITVEFTVTLFSQQITLDNGVQEEWKVLIECDPVPYLQNKKEK